MQYTNNQVQHDPIKQLITQRQQIPNDNSTERKTDLELPDEVNNNQQNESDEDYEETDYKYSSSKEEETEKEDQTTYEAFPNNTAT